MKIERNCRTCGTKFVAQKLKQWYCSRKCFKKDYFKRSKDIKGNFPKFTCEDCGNTIELRIDPITDEYFWTNFKCPFCNPEIKKTLTLIKTSKKIFVAF